MVYGIDTNILVRFIVADHPQQSKQAYTFITKNCTKENPGFISHIVLCELVWVLQRSYNFPKKSIIETLKLILISEEFNIQYSQIIFEAIREYEIYSGDFADYLIGQIGKINSSATTITFDKKASQSKNFRLLS
ncbi:MAG: PIN domain-containing protein [Calditrichaeota bacterium]|nr:MAG: PIN domain-containing protein [Calditrichota bacterium]MBL1206131.1 PIN domain-containing protein [Calditrichota bacterium]NOG45956.1 type II toxin-antitoxin system VapC family toxin [Calditrichota bacterium]